MANFFAPSLQGDGINCTFFQLLWNKTICNTQITTDLESTSLKDICLLIKKGNSSRTYYDTRNQAQVRKKENRPNKSNNNLSIRIPDTIIFQFGQPVQWYFTSEQGGKLKGKNKETSILRKRKQNLTVEKIEEAILNKSKASHKGSIDPKIDVVAYFVSAKEFTARNRHEMSSNVEIDESGRSCDCCSTCDITYFNVESFRKFKIRKK